jgi:TonB-linked SusC/RagA family outer membrane protein
MKRTKLKPPDIFFQKINVYKLLLTIKISLILIFGSVFHASAVSVISEMKISLMMQDVTVREVINEIERQGGISFLFNDDLVGLNTRVNASFRNQPVKDILENVLGQANLMYQEIKDNFVVLLPKPQSGTIQQQKIIGRITDREVGDPLPGVNIVIEGTNLGTITDMDGRYEIEVPSTQSILIFSFVGYLAERIPVGNQTVINVNLLQDITALSEVVVIGYGVQRRSDITGTVASLPRERLDMVPNLNVAQAIQGAVPGVMVRSRGGGAEPSQTIMVRGRNSIKANNDPLIIVDGIPYGGSLNDINPNDVESIEILKDASAAAIYGSRGSNGVVLITSKEGSVGKTRFGYEGRYGVTDVIKTHRLLTGPEFYEFKKTRSPNAMTASEEQNYLDGTWTDWTKLAMRTGHSQDHNLSISGGFGETKYYLGLGLSDIKGIAKNDDFRRLSTRINVETKVLDWLSVGTRTNLSFDDASGAPANFDLVRTNPLTKAYDEFGRLTVYPWPDNIALGNHLAPLLYDDLDKSYQILSNNYAIVDFPFVKGLSYRLNTGVRTRFTDRAQYRGRNTTSGHQSVGYASTSNSVSNNTVIENILNYNRDFGIHNIFATALYSYEGSSSKGNSLVSRQFANDFFSWYGQANVNIPSKSFNETNLLSQMLRLNYSYASRYLMTFTVRRDGYSGFGAQTKWGTFPSVALGWNLANEDFFPLGHLFSMVKLRGSYGLNGNQAIGAYESISRLTSANIHAGSEAQIGYKPSKLGLDNLGWESSRTLNFGLDVEVFDGRITGDFNWYRTNTFDLLLDRSISPVHGLTRITQNIGQTQNNGLEMVLNTRNISTNNFQWSTTGILSYNKNKIVSLYGFLDESGKEIDDVANAWFIGKPIHVHYDFVWVGTWQEHEADEAAKYGSKPGHVKLMDFDGDGLTADDKRIIGQEDPKLIWGLTNSLSYSNFTLNFFIHGLRGATMFHYLMSDAVQGAEVRYGTIKKNWWTPENPTNDWIKNEHLAEQMGGFSMNVYERNDYIRLKDVSLAYDLPQSLIGKTGLSRLRVYVTGRNLATITKSTFLDPEFPETSDQRSIPMHKEYLFGLSLGF